MKQISQHVNTSEILVMTIRMPQTVLFRIMEISFLSFKWKNMRVGDFVTWLSVVP